MVAGARRTVETPRIESTTAAAMKRPRLSSHAFRTSIFVPAVISVVPAPRAADPQREEESSGGETGSHPVPGDVAGAGDVGGAGHQPGNSKWHREPVQRSAIYIWLHHEVEQSHAAKRDEHRSVLPFGELRETKRGSEKHQAAGEHGGE